MTNLKTLRFEPLSDAHLPSILAIENQSHSAPWSELAFRADLDHQFSLFRVALLQGQVVGYAASWLIVDECHITNVAIDPEFRRQGIATRLLVRLLEEARQLGMACATLEVRQSNQAALQLYLDLGFIETAVRKGYYPDNREDARELWLYDLAGWNAPKVL